VYYVAKDNRDIFGRDLRRVCYRLKNRLRGRHYDERIHDLMDRLEEEIDDEEENDSDSEEEEEEIDVEGEYHNEESQDEEESEEEEEGE
ncbi:hypothetical protein PFISCL1PPCAC_26644, partial [Pristionchus fissidentatus]